MKLSDRNWPFLARLLFLCVVAGTLLWELISRILALVGLPIDLSLGPVGFDAAVLRAELEVNPGSLAGIPLAIVLFRRS